MRIIGFVPSRMSSTRLPGKPLRNIVGMPMLEHVFLRSKLYNQWDDISIATCDLEIKNFCISKNYNFVMTSFKHKRCLDRVYEATNNRFSNIKNNDIIVCIQGDEPMLYPDMISTVVRALIGNKNCKASILGMKIVNKEQYYSKNIVKIVSNINNEILYCSRSPIPYVKDFNARIKAMRIYGIYAFRYSFLKEFYELKASRLEILESCDQNRLCEQTRGMYVAPYPYKKSFSVDTESDLSLVDKFIRKDPFLKKYI